MAFRSFDNSDLSTGTTFTKKNSAWSVPNDLHVLTCQEFKLFNRNGEAKLLGKLSNSAFEKSLSPFSGRRTGRSVRGKQYRGCRRAVEVETALAHQGQSLVLSLCGTRLLLSLILLDVFSAGADVTGISVLYLTSRA
jgi:hypothetical protein